MSQVLEPDLSGMQFSLAELDFVWIVPDETEDTRVLSVSASDGGVYVVASGLTPVQAYNMKQQIYRLKRIAERLTRGA